VLGKGTLLRVRRRQKKVGETEGIRSAREGGEAAQRFLSAERERDFPLGAVHKDKAEGEGSRIAWGGDPGRDNSLGRGNRPLSFSQGGGKKKSLEGAEERILLLRLKASHIPERLLLRVL